MKRFCVQRLLDFFSSCWTGIIVSVPQFSSIRSYRCVERSYLITIEHSFDIPSRFRTSGFKSSFINTSLTSVVSRHFGTRAKSLEIAPANAVHNSNRPSIELTPFRNRRLQDFLYDLRTAASRREIEHAKNKST